MTHRRESPLTARWRAAPQAGDRLAGGVGLPVVQALALVLRRVDAPTVQADHRDPELLAKAISDRVPKEPATATTAWQDFTTSALRAVPRPVTIE